MGVISNSRLRLVGDFERLFISLELCVSLVFKWKLHKRKPSAIHGDLWAYIVRESAYTISSHFIYVYALPQF